VSGSCSETHVEVGRWPPVDGRGGGADGASGKGASGRIRTCDTWYRKPVLYPLSYGGLRQRRETEHYRATLPG
jgi:hypothetical protein